MTVRLACFTYSVRIGKCVRKVTAGIDVCAMLLEKFPFESEKCSARGVGKVTMGITSRAHHSDCSARGVGKVTTGILELTNAGVPG